MQRWRRGRAANLNILRHLCFSLSAVNVSVLYITIRQWICTLNVTRLSRSYNFIETLSAKIYLLRSSGHDSPPDEGKRAPRLAPVLWAKGKEYDSAPPHADFGQRYAARYATAA